MTAFLPAPYPTQKNRTATAPPAELGDCKLFSHYNPKPGGQTEFWKRVPFGIEMRSQSLDIEARFALLRGGVGSGKSYCGAAFACTRAYFDPFSRGLISANEYGQLETSTLVALAEFCRDFNVPLSPYADSPEETAALIARRRRCKIFDATVLVLSASKFGGETKKSKQGGRGLQIRWFWGDEWCYADKKAFETVNGRLGRGKGILKGFGLITSTLNVNNPYNWVYDIFDDPERDEEKSKLYFSVNCLTQDNDSLDGDYVKSLMGSYTPELIQIELMGAYAVSVEGLIFQYFSRAKHATPQAQLQKQLALHISFDFNRSPACALVAQQQDNKIVILQEFYLLNSDTFKLAAAVVARVREINPPLVYIYGDASGKQQTANSQTTNWAIVHNALLGIKWVRRYGESNPSVVDTINSCNCLFIQNRLKVHSSCIELIKDFEFLKDDGKQGIDKKTDLNRSHLADCVRYLVHTLYPYRSATGGRAITGGKLKTP
jgi:Terminase large subunit, T4likevirus-type, N-terminal